MSKNTDVTASDVIDLVIEHLENIKNCESAIDSQVNYSAYNRYKEASNVKLREALDDYVDHRISKMLYGLGLLKAVSPYD